MIAHRLLDGASIRALRTAGNRFAPFPMCLGAHRRDGTACTLPLLSLLGGCIVSELERALVIGRATYERWLGTDPLEIEAAATALWVLDPRHPLLPELEIRVHRAERLRDMLLRALLEATNSAAGTQTRRLA
jgi:hypothetical protein